MNDTMTVQQYWQVLFVLHDCSVYPVLEADDGVLVVEDFPAVEDPLVVEGPLEVEGLLVEKAKK